MNTTDAPDLATGDLPVTYPGSSETRRMVSGKVEDAVADAPEWEHLARPYVVSGKTVNFYPIGALGLALGERSTTTLRKWEAKGWLPAASFRTSGEKQDRLYTEFQVRGLLALAREEGLMDPNKRVSVKNSNFPARAHDLFERLAEG